MSNLVLSLSVSAIATFMPFAHNASVSSFAQPQQSSSRSLLASTNGDLIPRKLSDVEIKNVLPQITGWSVLHGKLHRSFKFVDFIQAFGFLTKVAIAAEKLGHHPEIYNVYNLVTFDLTTHDVGGISTLDIELAKQINSLQVI